MCKKIELNNWKRSSLSLFTVCQSRAERSATNLDCFGFLLCYCTREARNVNMTREVAERLASVAD